VYSLKSEQASKQTDLPSMPFPWLGTRRASGLRWLQKRESSALWSPISTMAWASNRSCTVETRKERGKHRAEGVLSTQQCCKSSCVPASFKLHNFDSVYSNVQYTALYLDL